jgi:hypothetical protein
MSRRYPGHARHLCKRCSRLGKEELEYRQAVRNIDRSLTWEGRLRRKQRATFERYRDHPNERVRRYVEELEAHWEEERRQWREMRRQEELWEEEWAAQFDEVGMEDGDLGEPLDDGWADEELPGS